MRKQHFVCSKKRQMKSPTEYIYDLRSDYGAENLRASIVKRSPFEQFEIWLAEAIAADLEEPNAMVLSTAAKDGKPSSRVVLLRGFDRKGFVFFTNYDSRKGREIAENPQASLLFYWEKLERQVRIEGVISKASRKISKEYFASRPRESQIGAWASPQSQTISSRRELEEKFAESEERLAGKNVECPDFWGGFVLKPEMFEFWQGRESRLHDRLRYTKKGRVWKIERLSP